MCTRVVYLISIFYTGSQVVVVVLHGSDEVLSAVSRYEGQTFWKIFVYWVGVVYMCSVGAQIPDKSI